MKLTYILCSKRKLDFVILGATGFTGRYVVQQVSNTLAKHSSAIVWGIAGRDKDRLSHVLSQTSIENKTNLSEIPVIEVDINDRHSLLRMCSESTLIVNCCGPYRLLGEQVVSACIDSGCHHLDVSGEPEFLETIQYKYHKQAIDRNVSIIGSCGFDSVPSDIGVQFLKSKFNGTLNSVEAYLRVGTTSDQRVTYNYATWHSLVYGYAYRNRLSQLRRQLYSTLFKTYQWKHRLQRRSIFRNQFGYCIPFPGSDRSVVIRTQLYNYSNCDERPAQIETYFTTNSLGAVMALLFVNTSVTLLAKYSKGRQILLKYPNIFSFGTFDRQIQPKRELLLQRSFDLILIGKGWSDTYSDPEYQPSKPPDKTVTAKISGGDLAYLDTSTIVTQITLLILQLSHKQTLIPGVLTPGVAFANTPLIDKLNENGIKFDIIQEK